MSHAVSAKSVGYLNIYNRKSVCPSVCPSMPVLRHRTSYHHQTFHDASLGPGEGFYGVAAEKKKLREGGGRAPFILHVNDAL